MHVPVDLQVRALRAEVPETPAALRSLLTPEQEEAAARRRESLLLAAGAGSGKTSVLVERFVRAVREDGIAPGGSSRSLSPSGPPRSCASGCGRGCSS